MKILGGDLGGDLGGSGLGRASIGGGRWRRVLQRFDWMLLGCIAVLVAVGLANLYSATTRTPHWNKFENQTMWTAVGVTVFTVFALVDYRNLHRLAWIGLIAAIAAIVVVRLMADPIKGSQRWLDFGGVHVQPSEVAKLAIILALARLLHDRANEEMRRADLAPAVIGLGLPVLLIASQPDLGTAILAALIIGSVCLLLVNRLWPLAGGMAAALAMLPVLWDQMEKYQKGRVLAFLDPAADPTGAGWHTQQSIFAVGSGRMSGKGFLNATQNQLDFLPEHWTDFPFSVWAEEWGFVGSVLLLFVFAFLIVWIVNVALRAPDRFGTAICLGVAAMVFWHVIVNIAMVLGLAPVVGVTLPFISYGGSSTITFFIGMGLVASVSMRRQPF